MFVEPGVSFPAQGASSFTIVERTVKRKIGKLTSSVVNRQRLLNLLNRSQLFKLLPRYHLLKPLLRKLLQKLVKVELTSLIKII